jgi:hypothetical protein
MATAVFEFSFQVPLLQTLLPCSDPVLHRGLYDERVAWAGRFRAHDAVLPGAPAQPLLGFVYGLCIAVLVACSLAIPWVEEHQIVRKIAAMTALF